MIKKKSFSIQKKELGLTSINQIRTFLQGKKIEILININGHNYGAAGDIIEFTSMSSASVNQTSLSYGIPGGNTFNYSQFRVVLEETAADFKAAIKREKIKFKEIEKNIEELQSKIDYLKETGLDKFDEDQYKALKVLELLDKPNLSKLEKSKIIADLIKL